MTKALSLTILSSAVSDGPNQPRTIGLHEDGVDGRPVFRVKTEAVYFPIVVGVFGDSHSDTLGHSSVPKRQRI